MTAERRDQVDPEKTGRGGVGMQRGEEEPFLIPGSRPLGGISNFQCLKYRIPTLRH